MRISDWSSDVCSSDLSRLPVSLRIGWFDTVPAPQGYDAYSFGGEKVTEGVKPLNPNGEETASPLPPTQTIPLTLGADGTARSAVDVPTSLDGPASMPVAMDYPDENGQHTTAPRHIPLYPTAIPLGAKTDP